LISNSVRFAVATVGAVVALGGISVASADKPGPSPLPGYTKDQCKNGGWENFKNPDGSQMFKNQGDCVSFFATGGKNKPAG
jgi:hypothetical protein